MFALVRIRFPLWSPVNAPRARCGDAGNGIVTDRVPARDPPGSVCPPPCRQDGPFVLAENKQPTF